MPLEKLSVRENEQKKKKKKGFSGDDRMAKQVKALTVKPDDINLIPRAHAAERENGFSGIIL